MSVSLALIVAGLILAIVDEIQARGTSILGWAVVVVCAALLWGRL